MFCTNCGKQIDPSWKYCASCGFSVYYAIKKQQLFESLDGPKTRLFNCLREKRLKLSENLGVPPFVIAHDMLLLELCRTLPTTEEQMLNIKGVGKRNLKWLKEFIPAIDEELKRETVPESIRTPFVSFEEAQRMVNFRLISGNYVAREKGWGFSLYHRERDVESETHKKLKELSLNYFHKQGYRTNQMGVGVEAEYAIADYFMVKDGKFYFVECLTNEALRSDPTIIERKLKLASYSNVWFVLEESANLAAFPKRENNNFLLVDIKNSLAFVPKQESGL